MFVIFHYFHLSFPFLVLFESLMTYLSYVAQRFMGYDFSLDGSHSRPFVISYSLHCFYFLLSTICFHVYLYRHIQYKLVSIKKLLSL